jgi:hypothetical protein
MNKQRSLFVLGALALTAISAYAFFDLKKVTVESSDGKRTYKRIDHNGTVRLSKRLSDAPCIQGRSWGFDRNGIWVDDGCRAVFEYNDGDGGRNPGPFPGWEMKRVTVESNDGKRTYRRIEHDGTVRLSKKLSDAPCVMGRTWGFDKNGIWVDDGCRAEFEVRIRRDDGGRDPWLPGKGVPNWAIGEWKGHGRNADDLTMRIRSDGTLTLRKRGDSGERRGEVRGDRVDIGDMVFRLERDGRESITLVPVRSNLGQLRFNKS